LRAAIALEQDRFRLNHFASWPTWRLKRESCSINELTFHDRSEALRSETILLWREGMFHMYKHALTFAVCVTVLGAAHPALAGSEPTGLWIDHTGRGGVEITDCGGKLCGRLVWLKDGANKKACGTQIIGNARPVGKDTWDGGWIYDPEKGQKYSVELKPIGSDKLRVLGYMGSKLFSETMIWKRPSAELKRCDDAEPGVSTTSLPTEEKAKPAADNPAPKAKEAEKSDAPKGKAAAGPDKDTGCKKYFPQIGEVVSVPCAR
jgi:uncharacterized protein (DUF2147 family)